MPHKQRHPRVVNKRWSTLPDHCRELPVVYVGRPGPLGNPFTVRDYGRKDAIRCYLYWLGYRPDAVAQIRIALAGKVLSCWCAPALCHGEILARLADGEGLADIRADILRDLETGQMTMFEEEE